MWKEVLVGDIKLLEKFCYIQNHASCGVVIDYTPNRIKQQLEKKTDCHAYYYEDDKFKIIMQYKWNNFYKKVQLIKCAISWDYTNKNIEVLDAVRLTIQHECQYLKERKQQYIYIHTSPTVFPEAQMMWYIRDKIIEMGLEEGMKITIEKKGDDDWLWGELVD